MEYLALIILIGLFCLALPEDFDEQEVQDER
ncbi:hypothetical protein SAMN06269117_12526 [Balnearium lithotrophicum]|uniref:Uncharacterized protein n=1 Tax=Balnearium lithotrophicum TaxID=223788 RepID=A0A521DT79_9BACT|nr:hypothetical protein SAMN06269117_12526 [Balnearium lithotrophicum]